MDQLTHEDRRRELDAGDTADVFALLIARRRLVVPFLVLGVVGALVVSFLIPPRYVATVTILPRQGGTSLPFLQNLAMFNLPSSVQGESLEDQFGRIIESDRVLEPIITAQWQDPARSGPARDLWELLDIPRDSRLAADPESSAKIKKMLRTRVISFERDKFDGFMELKVTVPQYPWLAASLADSLTAQLGRFMLAYRSGKAQEQSRFVADRVQETEAALHAADDELSRFIQANQSYSQSAPLAQEYRRLNREVESLTSVWADLRRQLELARIESNDRKQPLDVLDSARVPVERAWPRHKLSAVIGLLLGLICWLFVVFASAAIRGVRSRVNQVDRR